MLNFNIFPERTPGSSTYRGGERRGKGRKGS